MATAKGPLSGIKVLEFAGIGPAPFAGMMLADLGADVLRIDRLGADPADDWWRRHDILSRSRRSVLVDLKKPEAVELVLELSGDAEALIEGFRPGVLERIGLGPSVVLARNPRLVYGRMTGWGQDGPLAQRAGHDINYTALTGVLHSIGAIEGAPIPPLNLVGDFGGGGMLLAFGVVSGVLAARSSGYGQVIDAAMIDGAALLMAWTATLRNAGQWTEQRGSNLLDGGAPNYAAYRTSDGEYLAVGAMEARFFTVLLDRLGLPVERAEDMADLAKWPALRADLGTAFAARTRAEWVERFDGLDVCVTPVLSMTEAVADPHLAHRGVLVGDSASYQPAPAPRFSRTPADAPGAPTMPGAGGPEALADWGVPPDRVADLRESGAIGATD
jgi:alpha-methylacyl-CoA racemase